MKRYNTDFLDEYEFVSVNLNNWLRQESAEGSSNESLVTFCAKKGKREKDLTKMDVVTLRFRQGKDLLREETLS